MLCVGEVTIANYHVAASIDVCASEAVPIGDYTKQGSRTATDNIQTNKLALPGGRIAKIAKAAIGNVYIRPCPDDGTMFVVVIKLRIFHIDITSSIKLNTILWGIRNNDVGDGQ